MRAKPAFHDGLSRWKARRGVGKRRFVWLPNSLPPGQAKVESKTGRWETSLRLVAKFASTWASHGGKQDGALGNTASSGCQIRFHLDKPRWKARWGVGMRCFNRSTISGERRFSSKFKTCSEWALILLRVSLHSGRLHDPLNGGDRIWCGPEVSWPVSFCDQQRCPAPLVLAVPDVDVGVAVGQ